MEKIIGKRIQEFRKKKGMTQDELSEIIDISPHYLSALERGIYNIKLETLVKILNTLGISADEVFCDVVEKSSAVLQTDFPRGLKPFRQRSKKEYSQL